MLRTRLNGGLQYNYVLPNQLWWVAVQAFYISDEEENRATHTAGFWKDYRTMRSILTGAAILLCDASAGRVTGRECRQQTLKTERCGNS